MRRATLRSILACVVLYAVYFASFGLIGDHVLPPARQSVFFLRDVLAKRIDIGTPKTLILGDSTAAFSYAAGSLPETLALPLISGSFPEIYYALRRYLETYPAPRCIVLTASYNWQYHRNNRFWDIYAFHGFYNPAELNELYNTSERVGDFPSAEMSKTAFFVEALLYRMHLRGMHLTDIQDAFYKGDILYKSNHYFSTLMRSNRGNINKSTRLFPFVWEPHEHLQHKFAPAPLDDEYLRQIMALAHERHIRMNWVQAPVSRSVLTDNAKAFYRDLGEHVRPIVTADSTTTFSPNPEIFPDDQLFSATHPNIAGAKRFTEEHRSLFEGCR